MDSPTTITYKDQLQKDCIALREKLAERKLIRSLARETRIPPTTLDRYLDGFGPDGRKMRYIIRKGEQLIAEYEAKMKS